jgi:hypothetical protein
MCVLIFSTTLVWNIFHYKKNWARYEQKCILIFKYSTGYSYQILMKLEFLNRFPKNIQISNFVKIRPEWEQFFHADRQTETHDETNSRFSQFCERV